MSLETVEIVVRVVNEDSGKGATYLVLRQWSVYELLRHP